jgi:hypothetical protein
LNSQNDPGHPTTRRPFFLQLLKLNSFSEFFACS